MPKQEVFMDTAIGDRRIQVLKTYDAAYAREAFDAMDADARKFLSLAIRDEDIPGPESPGFADSLWQALEEGAREEWNTFSYFVVTQSGPGGTTPLFVSTDWPTAEAFAKTLTRFADTA